MPRITQVARSALAAALVFLAASLARADAVSEYHALHDQMLERMGAAIVHFMDLEQASAIPDLDVAITAGDAVLAHVEGTAFGDQVGAKLQRRIRGRLRQSLKDLRKARALAAKEALLSHKALKKARRALKSGIKATQFAAKVPSDRVVLVEQNARSAGFHGANATVPFTVILPPGCEETPVVTVANAYGSNAVTPGTVSPSPDGSYQVQLSAGWGAGRVTVTVCGNSDTWLVYNGGIDSRVGTAAQVFTGSWSGAWNVTRPDDCAGFSGGWSATLAVDAKGRISGTWDAGITAGSLSGRISAGGLATWTGAGGGVTFQGSVQGGSISGNFTGPVCEFDPQRQRTRGTFSGGKN